MRRRPAGRGTIGSWVGRAPRTPLSSTPRWYTVNPRLPVISLPVIVLLVSVSSPAKACLDNSASKPTLFSDLTSALQKVCKNYDALNHMQTPHHMHTHTHTSYSRDQWRAGHTYNPIVINIVIKLSQVSKIGSRSLRETPSATISTHPSLFPTPTHTQPLPLPFA